MISSKTYTEVYVILQTLGDEYITKIPNKLYEHIENQRNKKSVLEIDISKGIEDQEISEQATDFIAYLNLQYWASEEEKNKLLEEYRQNDVKYEKELNERYNPDKLFKKQKKQNYQNDCQEMVVYKENIFSRIIKFLKRKFK